MSPKLKALLAQQNRLTAKSAAQRASVASAFEAWRKPISWVDRGLSALQLVHKNRIVLYGAFALLATYRPATARKALLVAVGALKLTHHLRDWAAAFTSKK